MGGRSTPKEGVGTPKDGRSTPKESNGISKGGVAITVKSGSKRTYSGELVVGRSSSSHFNSTASEASLDHLSIIGSIFTVGFTVSVCMCVSLLCVVFMLYDM